MTLLKEFDFTQLDNPDFKEDSVREELIMPILNKLGYKRGAECNIVSSKKLEHPYVYIGSQKRPINQYPDYLLQIEGLTAWVLDAKAPNENILEGKNVEQTYSYAIHPEIRAKYFALCNGREFSVFKIDDYKPELVFPVSEVENYFEQLSGMVGPDRFAKSVTSFAEKEAVEEIKEEGFNYLTRPLLKEIKVRKQGAKRHFGVHGYFTKQVWNVVGEYIKNYSQPGDLILDPFGGSGITAVEALVLKRKAIHIDLNPLSVFLVDALTAPVDIGAFAKQYEKIKKEFEKNCPNEDREISGALSKYEYPRGIRLSKDADVETIEKLFTKKQLEQLAYLKHLIYQVKDENTKKSLLLAFSSTVTKINLTYHPSKSRGDNAGDSSAFRYYRYRIAKEPVELDVLNTFEIKVKKVLSAKKELASLIEDEYTKNLQVYRGDATHLDKVESESVDYIYTDPPYGSKIAYLDLSTMWNAWLGFEVTDEDFKTEIIEGGSRSQTKDIYSTLLSKSIEEMYRVLKFDRWLSFVFSHKDPYYWHLIVDTAEKVGFEYAGAVKQDNGQSSFKKRQHSFTVLSDQLILNFKKVRNPKSILKANLGSDVGSLVLETIESTIAKNDGANLDEINEALVVQGLELGFLDTLSKHYKDLTPLLKENFDYDEESEKYILRTNTRFRTHVPDILRIRYYLLSFLRRRERENNLPDFDDIILNLIPLLKNGHTPEDQTILSVLKEIGEKTSGNKWKLKADNGQRTLF